MNRDSLTKYDFERFYEACLIEPIFFLPHKLYVCIFLLFDTIFTAFSYFNMTHSPSQNRINFINLYLFRSFHGFGQSQQQFLVKFIILFMLDSHSLQRISAIVETPFESRSQSDHRVLSHLIVASLPHCSAEMGRKLSFFLQILPKQQEPEYGSTLLFTIDNNQQTFQSMHYHKQPSSVSILSNSHIVLSISASATTKCELMAFSIQQEIKWLQSSEYFKQVPKRRFYSVIQQAQTVVLTYRQQLTASIRDVFLARRGEFSYEAKEKNQEKNIQILAFREGHLFSHMPFSQDNQQNREESHSKQTQNGPILTVRCKSSKGVFYRFSREYFSSQLLHYCHSLLASHSHRMNALLKQRADRVSMMRKPNSKLLGQTITRSLSMELQSLKSSRASCARKDPPPKEPQPILDISEKSHDYRTLKNSQPPRNKLYSRSELAKLCFDPQKNESDLLLWKKSKCLRLRELSQSGRGMASKAQTMMQFIKFAVQFEKTRRKPSVL